jgi:hypothetical protein
MKKNFSNRLRQQKTVCPVSQALASVEIGLKTILMP